MGTSSATGSALLTNRSIVVAAGLIAGATALYTIHENKRSACDRLWRTIPAEILAVYGMPKLSESTRERVAAYVASAESTVGLRVRDCRSGPLIGGARD